MASSFTILLINFLSVGQIRQRSEIDSLREINMKRSNPLMGQEAVSGEVTRRGIRWIINIHEERESPSPKIA